MEKVTALHRRPPLFSETSEKISPPCSLFSLPSSLLRIFGGELPYWGLLGSSWGALGVFLGSLGVLLGCSWSLFGPSQAAPESLELPRGSVSKRQHRGFWKKWGSPVKSRYFFHRFLKKGCFFWPLGRLLVVLGVLWRKKCKMRG